MSCIENGSGAQNFDQSLTHLLISCHSLFLLQRHALRTDQVLCTTIASGVRRGARFVHDSVSRPRYVHKVTSLPTIDTLEHAEASTRNNSLNFGLSLHPTQSLRAAGLRVNMSYEELTAVNCKTATIVTLLHERARDLYAVFSRMKRGEWRYGIMC